MPRPAMTMVFQRPARSSRLSNAAPPVSVIDQASSSDAVPETTSSADKRVRKPSQRMLEALQREPQEPASDASSSKSKRASPAFSSPSPSKKAKKSDAPVDNEPSSSASDLPSKSSGKNAALLATEIANTPTEKEPEAMSKRTRAGKEVKTTKVSSSDAPEDTDSGTCNAEDAIPEKEEPKSSKKVPRLKISIKKNDDAGASASPGKTTSVSPAAPKQKPVPDVEIKEPKLKHAKKPSKKAAKTVDIDEEEFIEDDDFEDDVDPELELQSVSEDYLAAPGDTSAGVSGDRRLTARQRAKLYGAEDHLIKLEDPQPKTPAADHQEKREEKNKKRREQAAQRREDLKKETVDKLLHKSSSSRKGAKGEGPLARKTVMYKIDQKGLQIFYAEGVEPMKPMLPISPPKPILCGVKGCSRLKQYCCKKTGVPLCSMECYKKNIISGCK